MLSVMSSEPSPRGVPSRENHLYGGQAVLEGVMMRGRDHWAVAVRRPTGDVHIESHDVGHASRRFRFFRWPGFRGVIALWQSLAIGVRALTISANQAMPEEERLSSKQMGISMTLAMLVFVGVFIIGPTVAFGFVRHHVNSSVLVNVLEGVFRVALFLGYLLLISRIKEIRRVFQYHGAEHKTIAAYEHEAPLEPASVDRFSTLHVRCGTNFLLIVMILTIFVFALFGNPGWVWRILSRIIAIPIIAGVAYEFLRLGARFQKSMFMRALMKPGLWMQRITTKPPTHDQIEVAIASFTEVQRREEMAAAPAQPVTT
jgi:uncharacterized protein YqhQ